MALAPKFAGQAYSVNVSPKAVNTVELFLDYACPFSAKMIRTLSDGVLPNVSKKYPFKVQFLFRQQIQPWHPSSTLLHEAAAAVLRLSPDQFWLFSRELFAKQTDFFDVKVVNEVRNDTYRRLAKIAASVGVDEEKVYGMLKISDKPGEDGSLNIGNEVTNDIKLMVKVGSLLKQILCVLIRQTAEPTSGSTCYPDSAVQCLCSLQRFLHALTIGIGYRGGKHIQQLHRSAMGGMAGQEYSINDNTNMTEAYDINAFMSSLMLVAIKNLLLFLLFGWLYTE